jgi:hypothetical protein
MPSFDYLELPIAGARSLTWQGDVLMDWLNSASAYGLDGVTTFGGVRYAYRFDAVLQSPSTDHTVLYERRGTKGLVLQGQRILREINRSYYQANVYDYPIALFDLPDGRAALAHCPNHYNQLEIELLETGERLTAREAGSVEPDDVFHSGLAADPDGKWLMSAGWFWHPFYEVSFHAVVDALGDASLLDRSEGAVTYCAEIASAVFLGPDRAVLASEPDAEHLLEDDSPDIRLRPGMIGVYRPSTRRWESLAVLGEPVGRLLAVDAEHVLALFGHPKLVHLPTARVVERWPQISSGSWNGCISGSSADDPPIGWDPAGKRLAIASAEKIQILHLVTPTSAQDAATP